ncbi:transposase [Planctobacterium marinum]|uniref:Transposase n=1 Tax=Planctobacterium marinum TaxID=1631968 RepID=A0AA48I1C3_9ALTE|nr:transposase [Planctobacterium marinum]
MKTGNTVQLLENQVWNLKNASPAPHGRYRILAILEEIETLILFPVDDASEHIRPRVLLIPTFMALAKQGNASVADYDLPSNFLVDENDLPVIHRQKMDANYDCIEDLVNDKLFLFDCATKERVRAIAKQAKKVGRDRKELSRLLTLYWRYGQTKISLAPKFHLCGGAGKDKTFTDKANGAKIKPRTLAVKKREKYIVRDKDREIFSKVINTHYLTKNKPTIQDVYDNMLDDHYSDEKLTARAENRLAYLPSLRQFKYFLKKNFEDAEVKKRRTSERDFQQNLRGLMGVSTQRSALPGGAFEIDATVADVHIVSSMNPQMILGRPTIYNVIDRASRLIAGFHVSLYYASWRAARQALANAFLPKSDFCALYGVDIEESEWPCAQLPLELVCDNGEMIGLEPTSKLTPMTQLSFTPPYRPDFKGVVEKRFDILNKKSLHKLMGTTRGGKVVRGERNPQKDAVLTLRELTKILIMEVLDHNMSIFRELAYSSKLLIQHDLEPSPINYWKIHMAKHKTELRACKPSDVIAQLLPSQNVSMTKYGVMYKELYYTSPEIEERKMHSVARTAGQWQLEARIDENTTSYIYVRLDKNGDFVKCKLSGRRDTLDDLPMIEADLMEDWIDDKLEQAKTDDRRKAIRAETEKILKAAYHRKKDAATVPFSQQVKNIKQNRKSEIDQTTNVIDTPPMPEKTSVQTSSKVTSQKKVIPLPQGPKRKNKGEDHES